jgi:hypothetical protein
MPRDAEIGIQEPVRVDGARWRSKVMMKKKACRFSSRHVNDRSRICTRE